MSLVRFDNVGLRFGDQVILEDASFSVEAGERVCMLGRNGAGKSSTFKLIMGELEPDSGDIEVRPELRLSLLDQDLFEASDTLAREVVATGLVKQRDRIYAYETLSNTDNPDRSQLSRLESLERQIVAGGGWAIEQQIDSIVSQLKLPGESTMAELSGGWRRRVALAQALVSNPDLLLLDEPTNHLDIRTIEWLERVIREFPGSIIFISHDRAFVQSLASKILEVDRGRVEAWPGSYQQYLTLKSEADAQESKDNALFDKRLAEEEAWIRRGVKARTTRNEGRVRALEELRVLREQRRAKPRQPRIYINESDQVPGRKVIELHNVSHAFDENVVLSKLTMKVMRGDRIGIVGNNGVGKSTLLNLMLGEIAPDSGTIKLGTNIEVAYFDQLRRQLDPSKTVSEIVGEGREYITMNGKKKHVVGYLTDFLFSAKRAMTPAGVLSGGEKNRAILAKLFTLPCNLLVLDEPTNDLDVDTLNALENRLREFDGTLITVSHDRQFLDNVVDKLLVFEDSGQVVLHQGGYSDWARRGRKLLVTDQIGGELEDAGRKDKSPSTKPTKMSYKLVRELEALPQKIHGLEEAFKGVQSQVTAPDFYTQDHDRVQTVLAEMNTLESQLDLAIERWAELEELQASFQEKN
ncbi:MAG: ATP-binding cassette domain-containing protein [Pseudomonadota bacterium]